MTAMRAAGGALSVALALAAGSAQGAVRRVPSEYSTIQAGVDAAASGDSVLVAPGVYTDYETRVIGGFERTNCVFLKAGVAILSEAGPELTSIDLQGVTGPGFVHVLFGSQFPPSETLVEGFTILGSPVGEEAVLVFNDAPNGARMVFRDCVVRDVDAGPTTVGGVGADEVDLDLFDCRFERCRGAGAGAVYTNANLYISGCVFEDCERKAVQALSELPNALRAVIEDTWFVGNRNPGAFGGALSVSQYGGGTELRRCVFVDNECQGVAGGASLGSGLVEDCVFWNNRSVDSWGGGIRMGSGDVRGCTFLACSGTPFFAGSAVVMQGDPSTFTNNIVAGTTGHAALVAVAGTTLTGGCNVFWNNPGGHAENYTLAPTDRVVDPQFCDESVGDLTLRSGSPCLPDGSGGCGRIGALGEGCGAVSLKAQTWGRLKETFRKEGGPR